MKRKNKLKLLLYTLIIILTFTYIMYRIFFTIPSNLGYLALTCSILILIVEIWEFLEFFIYYLNILCVNKTLPKASDINKIQTFPDIDVLIATINEPEILLEKTIIACKNMHYPDKTKIHIYLCDDGNRTNIKKLAHKHNINYLYRINNKNAKAGNYNHALSHISSPFVATFDADMAPTPDFLLKMLPHFYDNGIINEKIGFIQSPQSFNNPDIFQYRFNLMHSIPFEQDYFYNSIQLAKNATNSAIYCGTNTLFSRKALNSCNGFATKTISEDIATGMLIESNGYKCFAINDITAHGTAVNDFTRIY